MTTLQLTHTPAEGTLLHGTSRGDASAAALKSVRHVAQWRWSRDLDAWYIRQSRDRRSRSYQIQPTADALRAAGFDVEVTVNDAERRPVAEQEADRAARSERRVERLEGRSERLTAQGEAGWKKAREYASLIPLGQPLMPDHYSYRRDVSFRAKIGRMEDRAMEALKDGEDAEQRAAAAAAHQKHREHGATTMRRIAKLEADLRRAQRNSSPIAEELEEKLTYWREYLRGLTEAGIYRVWTAADFRRGDFVATRNGWMEVKRVNPKSLTVPHIHDQLAQYGHTWSLPYDEVWGRRTAEEHAAATAAKATA